MAGVILKKGDSEKEFSVEHAQNILSSPVNAKVDKKDQYKLADKGWTFKDDKLKKKSK